MTNTVVKRNGGMDSGEVVGYEVAPDGRAWVQVLWLGFEDVETLPADTLRAAPTATAEVIDCGDYVVTGSGYTWRVRDNYGSCHIRPRVYGTKAEALTVARSL